MAGGVATRSSWCSDGGAAMAGASGGCQRRCVRQALAQEAQWQQRLLGNGAPLSLEHQKLARTTIGETCRGADCLARGNRRARRHS